MVKRDARSSMVRAAARLLARDGLDGTSFGTVLDESGAPRGSIYHHFPGGKTQLLQEATRLAGSRFTAGIRALSGSPAPDVAAAVVAGWRGVLEASDCGAGCAVAAVTADAGQDGALVATAGEVFAEWHRELAAAFAAGGVPADRAPALASHLVAGIEGALLLARAARDVSVYDEAAGELVEAVRRAVSGPAPAARRAPRARPSRAG